MRTVRFSAALAVSIAFFISATQSASAPVASAEPSGTYVPEALAAVVSETQEPIAEAYYGKLRIPVSSIPRWKIAIMDEFGLADSEKINYHTYGILECPSREDGFCLSKRKSDAGPFQINFVHKKEFGKSYDLVVAGLKATAERDWEKAVAIRDELYRFQLRWTMDHAKYHKESWPLKCGRKPTETEVFRCLLIAHNGNNSPWKDGRAFKYSYADRWIAVKEALSKLVDWEHSFLPEESEALHSFLVVAEEASVAVTRTDSDTDFDDPESAVSEVVEVSYVNN